MLGNRFTSILFCNLDDPLTYSTQTKGVFMFECFTIVYKACLLSSEIRSNCLLMLTLKNSGTLPEIVVMSRILY